jgi:hypothetical protein
MERAMTKLLHALAALLLWTASAGAADAVFPSGSMVGLVPPQGMSLARSFSGFQDDAQRASIVLTVFPPQAFAEVSAGFGDDARLSQQGITVQTRETLTIEGHPAILLAGRQQAGALSVRKWILVVGAPSGVALVVGQVMDDTTGSYPDAAIRAALTSVTFRPPLTHAQQIAALPFTVAAAGKFRVFGFMGGMSAMLTDGPKDADPDHEQAALIALYVAQPVAPAERNAFARGGFLGMQALQRQTIGTAKSLTIGGLPGHEIIGTAQSRSGVSLKVVQWTIFATTGTILVMGSARPAQFDAALTDFVTMRNGIRPK